MTLLEIRMNYNLQQIEAANIIGIPVRTYRRYETNESYGSAIKRSAFVSSLVNSCEITEDKGLLNIDYITEKITNLFDNKYNGQINFCYIFGSYAKGTAKENSDVDLYVSSNLTGLKFVGLIENISQTLHKKVDVIRESELQNNLDLINEILRTGIKIYC